MKDQAKQTMMHVREFKQKNKSLTDRIKQAVASDAIPFEVVSFGDRSEDGKRYEQTTITSDPEKVMRLIWIASELENGIRVYSKNGKELYHAGDCDYI